MACSLASLLTSKSMKQYLDEFTIYDLMNAKYFLEGKIIELQELLEKPYLSTAILRSIFDYVNRVIDIEDDIVMHYKPLKNENMILDVCIPMNYKSYFELSIYRHSIYIHDIYERHNIKVELVKKIASHI